MTSPTIGYSGTPLAKKLGMAAGCIVTTKYAPDNYREWLSPIPAGLVFEKTVSDNTHIVHLFCDDKKVLKLELEILRKAIKPDAMVWVSWPK